MPDDVRAFLDELDQTYVRLHTAKEDAFWTNYMGLADDADLAQRQFDEREIALQRFLQDPARLERVRAVRASAGDRPSEEDRVALQGWERMFAAHVIEGERARRLAEEIIEAEGALARARRTMQLGYLDPAKGFVKASSVQLGQMVSSEPNGELRRAAWDGLRGIEDHVLAQGFIEVLKQRNELGRLEGAEDYYDWKVRRNEGMTKGEVFALLDELEAKTRERARQAVDELSSRVAGTRMAEPRSSGPGPGPVAPWDIRYLTQGDVTRAQDPYFLFRAAVGRWGRSFAALGIDYRGAHLKLDLVDRAGKYENGFMHGPEIAWRERGTFHPARIQFTANAIPGMVGSGHRATQTLFHEGGHAAHFANIDMPAPCFGQEFAPTSIFFCETQSMFLDSILDDADWQSRYALNAEGVAMPWELVEHGIHARQPMAAWNARAMLAVCYGERALYELPDDQLTPERILATLREVEQRLLFLEDGSPRPVLSVPHLLSGESSAYYHGYVLAEMGVHQTREFFLERDGHLMDNPRIGPDLRRAYWAPGNGTGANTLIQALTGNPLGADALARHLNQTVDEAVADARRAQERARDLPAFSGAVELNARVEIVHGRETVAVLEPGGSFDELSDRFSDWIQKLEGAREA